MSRRRRRPRYLDALLRHVDQVELEPGVHHVEIHHQDHCPFMRGGECCCKPVITSGPGSDRKFGGGEP